MNPFTGDEWFTGQAAMLTGLLTVLVIDQLTKWGLRRGLAGRSISLRPWGSLKVTEAAIWLARRRSAGSTRILWAIWLPAAAAIAMVARRFPAAAGFAGMLLGGSLSNLVESFWRGAVTDYVQLAFWPSFNLADAGIVVGTGGLAVVILGGIF